jgi:Protein of unknown function (DUF1566)
MKYSGIVLVLLIALFIIGCGDSDCDTDCEIGSEGCQCTSGGACDDGLTCLSDLCVNTGSDSDSDADTDGDTDSDTDADIDGDTDADADSDSDANVDTDTDADAGDDAGDDADISDCDGGRYDPSSGLCWQHPKASGNYQWRPAMDYCEDLDLGGHTDWVLPTLQYFIDMLGGCDHDVLDGKMGSCSSCAESTVCHGLFGSDTSYHWSSSPDVYPLSAYYANFASGAVDTYLAIGNASARCVRPGP